MALTGDYKSLIQGTVNGATSYYQTKESGGKVDAGQVIQYASNLLTNFFCSLADKEAEAEVQDGQKKVTNLENAQQTAAAKTKSLADDIIAKVKQNEQLIAENLKNIDDLNSEKEELNKKVKAEQDKIEAQKNIVDNAATPAERLAALKAIEASGKVIEDLVQTSQDLASKLASQTATADALADDNAALNQKATDVIDAGNSKQQEYLTEAAAQTAKNTQVGAKAADNTREAIQAEAEIAILEASGVATGAITFGASEAATQMKVAKLQQVVKSNTSAAATRTTGSAQTAAQITTQVAGINGNIGDSTFALNTIGSAVTNAEAINFDFYDASNALGSYLETASETLGSDSENIIAEAQRTEEEIEQSENNSDDNKKDNITFDYKPQFELA